jgi:glutamyl-Q tRNA(Asp) synthetase
MDKPVFRFAPSPNGELHLGHALSALTGYEMARRMGGRFLVRIEDIDLARSRSEFIESIFTDLDWLGIKWEVPVLRQSEHFEVYRAAAARLLGEGFLYPCFATRAELAAALAARPDATDPDGAPLMEIDRPIVPAPEVARRQAAGMPYALRLDMKRAIAALGSKSAKRQLSFLELDEMGSPRTVVARPERWGDAVIVRKDVPASYHLAVVVDDARQGITHVTRGLDLFPATDLHRLLQELLGLPQPIYHHHRLVTDTAGRKLAKSARDTTLRSLREGGISPREVRRIIGLA